MKFLLSIIFLIISFNLSGQLIKQDSISNKLAFGFFPNLLFSDIVLNDNPQDRALLFSLETRPYIAYNLYKNIFLGMEISYEFFYSNYYVKDNFMEYGFLFRYIAPFHFDKKILNRFRFYTGLSYCKTNYRMVNEVVNSFEYDSIIIEENFIISNRLDQSKISVPIGLQASIWKNVYVDLNWQYNKFINGSSEMGFMCGIGISLVRRK